LALPNSLHWNWTQSTPVWLASLENIRAQLEAALTRDPGNELLQLRVLEARVAAGRLQEAVDLGITRHAGQNADKFSAREWDGTLAKALFRLGRHEECLSRIDAALAVEDDADLRLLRIEALLMTNRPREAASALDSQRGNPALVLRNSALDLAQSHWGAEDVLAQLDLAASRNATPGDHAEARLHCLLELGRTSEVAAMVDLDRHVAEIALSPPSDWSQSSFLDALRNDIGELGSLLREPTGYSTSGGKQTRNGLPANLKAFAALTGLIQREIEQFWESLPDSDPIRMSRPQRPVFHAWVVVLDRNGYQQPHIHAEGWLSGVYYIATPDTDSKDGALRVGLPRIAGAAMPWPVRRIAPSPGKLVLFPSFLRHDTTPHLGKEPRICIAFDILHE
jgi:uncharacterized protein (TIGR02466 family)